MLKRKIEEKIIKWIKESDNIALLIDGARQIGKTTTILYCLDKTESNYISFNLVEEPKVSQAIENSFSVDELILNFSLLTDKKIIPYETIFFLDEAQVSKELFTKIKFFVNDKRYKFILSGSLLGIELNSLRSAPVGFLRTLHMYPLDFFEFLQIYNISDDVINILKKSFENLEEVPELINSKMLEIFKQYLIIGGMPKACNKFKETHNVNDVIDIHNDIILQYKLDFSKYEESNKKLILKELYDLIPAELNSKNKRFNFKQVNDKFRYQKNESSFLWLKNAGVAIPVYNTTEPIKPLILNEKSSLFKLFLSDIGMLTTMLGKASKIDILNENSSMNNGAIYENFVAQELNSHGFDRLYYYNNKKQGELDFLIEHDNKVLPIEVKSGKDYTKHSALNNILSNKDYKVEKAYVLANTNIIKKDNIIYLPIYMIMFINKEKEEDFIIDIDKYKFN